jgi:hypothetical protein
LYVGDEEKIAPVEREIRELSSTLQLVKDEQAYLVVRERVHRNSESDLTIILPVVYVYTMSRIGFADALSC